MKHIAYGSFKSRLYYTFCLRVFSFFKVPLLSYLCPTVIRLDQHECITRIGFGRRSKNHLNSMYFGALTIGADTAAGLLAAHLIRSEGKNIPFVFKSVTGEFKRRVEAHAYFICRDGQTLRETIQRAVRERVRVECPVTVTVQVPGAAPEDETAAVFRMTLSMKFRE